MRRIIIGLALGTSVLAFIAIAGTGLFLATVEQSGERGLGLILAAAGTGAFAAVLLLLFAPAAFFRGPAGKGLGAMMAAIGLLPMALLAVAALFFVGVPYGSLVPRLDWALFAAGLLFAAGAVATAALGVIRTAWSARPSASSRIGPDELPPSQGDSENAEALLYTPLVAESARKAVEADRRSMERAEGASVRQA